MLKVALFSRSPVTVICTYYFPTEQWLNPCGEFPQPLRAITTFRLLAIFRSCSRWSVFPTFVSHELFTVATGVSPHRAVETESSDKQSHRGAQLVLWCTCRGMSKAITKPDCVPWFAQHHLCRPCEEKANYKETIIPYCYMVEKWEA